MKIFIGTDHRGVEIKKQIKEYLEKQGHEIILSSLPNSANDDYPDFAFETAKKVTNVQESLGILICGNGIGISIAANKVKDIRCARVTTKEEAFAARNHNGANMIAFGGLSFELVKEIIDEFINTPFATEERHLKRIQKITDYEKGIYNEP